MRPDLETVTERHTGVFGAVLWCPNANLLRELLDPEFSHVLVSAHHVGRGAWEPFDLPIVTPTAVEAVVARSVTFDYLITTTRFLELLPRMPPGIRAVQLRRVPPDYFDLSRIHGAERFRLLDECGWHVLLDTPANDYGHVFSPHRDVVAAAIRLHQSMNPPDT